MRKYFIIIIVAFILGGCNTTKRSKSYASDINFSGETHTNEKLRADSFNLLMMYMAAGGCIEIASVTSTVTLPPEGPDGNKLSKEQWEILGCGKTFKFEMTFTEDGQGGAFIAIDKL